MLSKLLVLVARELLLYALGRKIRATLPRVFDTVDADLTELQKGEAVVSAPLVERTLARAIRQEAGVTPAPSQVEALIGLYSPVAAAIKSFSK